jgi:phosphoglycerol transferase MdoB-like AlkP superfamily enzyme
MAKAFANHFKFVIAVLLIGIMISVSGGSSEVTEIIPQAVAQSTSAGNMTTPMLESARFHLKAADAFLSSGDNPAALDQIALAEMQLSLLNMSSQGTSMNPTQAIEFITGGSLSSTRMGANCIIDNQAMVRCMQ